MRIKMCSSATGITGEQLNDVEKRLRLRLPDDYRRFLLESNGCVPESNIFYIEGENNSGVREFFSIDQAIDEKTAMEDRIPPPALPIADDECGNLICLKYSNAGWCVVFWDHETEQVFELAESFDGFLQCLRPFGIDDIGLKPAQVIDAWIDPDFLKSITKK